MRSVLLNIVNFTNTHILGMKWLNAVIAKSLELIGLDSRSPWTRSLQFFIYDIIKISLLLCVFILCVSYIQSYFPPERAKKNLGRFKGIRANIAAALLGTVTPFCSCSSIPLFIGFTSAGLPVGVTFSFLISSPMVDLGSLALLSSIFGIKLAAIYVLAGLVIAVAGGTFIEKFKMERYVESFVFTVKGCDAAAAHMSRRDRVRYAAEQVRSSLSKVFPYIAAGVGIGACIHNWIPGQWIVYAAGKESPFAVIAATLVGIPMYGDIFGAIPVAEALLAKGAQLGSVVSFMMALTTLSLPSMIMLRKAVRPTLLIVFISICTAGIIMIGYLFNAVHLYVL